MKTERPTLRRRLIAIRESRKRGTKGMRCDEMMFITENFIVIILIKFVRAQQSARREKTAANEMNASRRTERGEHGNRLQNSPVSRQPTDLDQVEKDQTIRCSSHSVHFANCYRQTSIHADATFRDCFSIFA